VAAAKPVFACAEVWGGNRPVDSRFELPGVRGRVYSQPCESGRGGDIHYVSLCGSGLLARMCLADVAGHGEAVGVVTEEIHRLLRRYMNYHDERRVLRGLNRRLVDENLSSMTTAVAVSYAPHLRRMSISYAGHPPAWFFRSAEQRWVRLPSSGATSDDARLFDLPLAVDGETEFSRRRLAVGSGDRVLILTDGVLEAPSPSGELYGDERLWAVLQRSRDLPPEGLIDAIVTDLHAHTGPAGFTHDDVTLLAAEFTRAPGTVSQIFKNRVVQPLKRLGARIFG
jgi:serine phosphatase RsbU (regulator of sigma subunit)